MFTRLMRVAALLSLVSLVMAAGAAAAAESPITVWIDQPRQPMIDAYLKAFPDKAKLIKAVIVDREQFPAKVLLFNNTNQGWPDVVFAEPRFVGRVADAAHQFPLDLKPLVPAKVLNAFAGMAGCTFGDKVYCLRNDLAHVRDLLQQAALREVRLQGAGDVRGAPGPQRQGGQGSPRLLPRHVRRRLDVHLATSTPAAARRTSW